MTHLFEIVPEEATQADLEWIDTISRFSYYEETYRDLLSRWIAGDLKFWRIRGVGLDGILAGRLIERSTLREFWIEFLAGRGLLKMAQPIHADIWEIASRAGASRVSGICQHKGLERVYERVLGVKPRATIFSEDAANGQV